ncbi:hypothetical protein CVT26_009262 [Gymnopilus dilepis]|uniref:HMG box domain-containing protein n=1 Tax=Gymnopilus dilepis TaxID=231916 RepID=A0A409YRP0_9AGAR|nr:hypothetical protein CVT26_009262 [Gymnopilus dilepis]
MSLSSITDEEDTFVKTSFTADEETFLEAYIPTWRARYYAGSSTARKGEKKQWVTMEPYPKFIAKFYAEGNLKPHETQLQVKIYRWFLNRTKDGDKIASNRRTNPSAELKKPRATHAFQLFTEENKEDIMKLCQEKTNTTSPMDNLFPFKESSKELWNALSQEAKDDYTRKASEKNELIKKGPSEQDIERNQANIIRNTLAALSNLTGTHWTGHGDVAFFVMGAYRKKDSEIATFWLDSIPCIDCKLCLQLLSGSVSNNSDFASTGFQRSLPNFKAEIGEPFKMWAENIISGGKKKLPSMQSPTADIATQNSGSLVLGFIEGYPVLPLLDVDKITPQDARALLQSYIAAAWKHGAGKRPESSLPWECLGSLDRCRILADPRPFTQFESLDPTSVSTGDTYSILTTILAEQKKGARALQFKFDDELQSADVQQVDKIDFSPPRPKGKQQLHLVERYNRLTLEYIPPGSLVTRPSVPRFTPQSMAGVSPGECRQSPPSSRQQFETVEEKEDGGFAETSSQLDQNESDVEDEGMAGRHSSAGNAKLGEVEVDVHNGRPAPQKRKKQVEDNLGEDLDRNKKTRKAPPAPKAKPAQKTSKPSKGRRGRSDTVTSNKLVKADTKSNVASKDGEKKRVAKPLPMREQSARIHDKKYRNTVVTIYS